nr:unnamed protein product [Callosobruchus chinensis]
MRNLAPFYQEKLALVDVKSLAELRDLGKRLEERKEAVENFVGLCRRSSTMEPDIAYVADSDSIDSCQPSISDSSRDPKGISVISLGIVLLVVPREVENFVVAARGRVVLLELVLTVHVRKATCDAIVNNIENEVFLVFGFQES